MKKLISKKLLATIICMGVGAAIAFGVKTADLATMTGALVIIIPAVTHLIVQGGIDAKTAVSLAGAAQGIAGVVAPGSPAAKISPDTMANSINFAVAAGDKLADIIEPDTTSTSNAAPAVTPNAPAEALATPDTPVASAPVGTYHIVYDGNGADGGNPPLDTNAYAAGASAAVLGNVSLTKSGAVFAGWNTAADGSGVACAPGVTVTIGSANVTLFAVWSPATVTV